MYWQVDEPIWLNVNGARLEGRCWGPDPTRAATIVLLHEGLGSVSLWRGFPEALAKATGCGVFAYSRRGYGASDRADLPRPMDYMTREAQDDLPKVLDEIGLRQGVLVGHSDGASIAAIYAGTFNDPRLEGICLLSPHFFTEPEGLASIAQAGEAFRTTDLKERLARHHSDPENAFLGWNEAWLNPDFIAWNIEDFIGAISVPVLAIQGEDDQYGTLAQLDALEQGLKTPFERLELPDCQHAPQFEKSRETLTALSDFLARQIGEAGFSGDKTDYAK